MSRSPIRPPVLAGTAVTAAVVTGAVVTAAAAGAVAARLCYAGLRQRPPGGDGTWSRVNHRGEPVTLLEGPAVALGGLAGSLAAAGLTGRERAALILAGAGAGALGSYDDLAGSGKRRGFRGHLGALAHGEVTTGAVKLLGIGAVGLAAGALAGPRQGRVGNAARAVGAAGPGGTVRPDSAVRPGGVAGHGGAGLVRVADVLVNAGLIAGGANLLNLFDLRPGRAIKVALGTGAMMSAASGRGRLAAAAPLAAAAALLPEDLGERAMLGDGGANALGAMLGTAAAVSLPRPARVTTLAVIAGLTAASEAVSFTKVIARTPPLNWLDMLGRRPPAPASTVPASGVPGSGAPAGGGPASAASDGAPPAGDAAPAGDSDPAGPAPR